MKINTILAGMAVFSTVKTAILDNKKLAGSLALAATTAVGAAAIKLVKNYNTNAKNAKADENKKLYAQIKLDLQGVDTLVKMVNAAEKSGSVKVGAVKAVLDAKVKVLNKSAVQLKPRAMFSLTVEDVKSFPVFGKVHKQYTLVQKAV